MSSVARPIVLEVLVELLLSVDQNSDFINSQSRTCGDIFSMEGLARSCQCSGRASRKHRPTKAYAYHDRAEEVPIPSSRKWD